MHTSLTKQISKNDIAFLKNVEQAIFPPLPRSFAALMEMYEINYMQLRLLCGDIKSLGGVYTSTQGNGISLRLEVLEQSSHTSVLLMTYDFSVNEDPRPDLQVQVYHDSRQANVISCRCKFVGEQANIKALKDETQLLCHWRANRFLFKWVKYLKRQGHQF